MSHSSSTKKSVRFDLTAAAAAKDKPPQDPYSLPYGIIANVFTRRLTDESIRKQSSFALRSRPVRPFFTHELSSDIRLRQKTQSDICNPLAGVPQEKQAHIELLVPEVPAGIAPIIGNTLTIVCPHCSIDRTLCCATDLELSNKLGLFPERPLCVPDVITGIESIAPIEFQKRVYMLWQNSRHYERYIGEPELYLDVVKYSATDGPRLYDDIKTTLSLPRGIEPEVIQYIEQHMIKAIPSVGVRALENTIQTLMLQPPVKTQQTPMLVEHTLRVFFEQRPIAMKLLHSLRKASEPSANQACFTDDVQLDMEVMRLYQSDPRTIAVRTALDTWLADPNSKRSKKALEAVRRQALVAALTNPDEHAQHILETWQSAHDYSRVETIIQAIKLRILEWRKALVRAWIDVMDVTGQTILGNIVHRRNHMDNVVQETENKFAALESELASFALELKHGLKARAKREAAAARNAHIHATSRPTETEEAALADGSDVHVASLTAEMDKLKVSRDHYHTLLYGNDHMIGLRELLSGWNRAVKDAHQCVNTFLVSVVETRFPNDLLLDGVTVHTPQEKLTALRRMHRIHDKTRTRKHIESNTLRTINSQMKIDLGMEYATIEQKITQVRAAESKTPGKARTFYCDPVLGGCGLPAPFVYAKSCDIYFQTHPGFDLRLNHVTEFGGLGFFMKRHLTKADMTFYETHVFDSMYLIPNVRLQPYPIDSWNVNVEVLAPTGAMPEESIAWFVDPFTIKGILRRIPLSIQGRFLGSAREKVRMDSYLLMTRIVPQASFFTNTSYTESGTGEVMNKSGRADSSTKDGEDYVEDKGRLSDDVTVPTTTTTIERDDGQMSGVSMNRTDRRVVLDTILMQYLNTVMETHKLSVAHQALCNATKRYWPICMVLPDPALPKRAVDIERTPNHIQNILAATIMNGAILPRRPALGTIVPDTEMRYVKMLSIYARLAQKNGLIRNNGNPYAKRGARVGAALCNLESFTVQTLGREIDRELTRSYTVKTEEDLNYCRAYLDDVQIRRLKQSMAIRSAVQLAHNGVLPLSKHYYDSSEDRACRDVYPSAKHITKKTGYVQSLDGLDNGLVKLAQVVRARRRRRAQLAERDEDDLDIAGAELFKESPTKVDFYAIIDSTHGMEHLKHHRLPPYSDFLYSNHLELGCELEINLTLALQVYVDLHVSDDVKRRHHIPLRTANHQRGLPTTDQITSQLCYAIVERHPVTDLVSITGLRAKQGLFNSALKGSHALLAKHQMDCDGDVESIKVVGKDEAAAECTRNIAAETSLCYPSGGTSKVNLIHDCVTCPSTWARSTFVFYVAHFNLILNNTLAYREHTAASLASELTRRMRHAAEQFYATRDVRLIKRHLPKNEFDVLFDAQGDAPRNIAIDTVARELARHLTYKHILMMILPFGFSHTRGERAKATASPDNPRFVSIAFGWLEYGLLTKEEFGDAERSTLVTARRYHGLNAAIETVDSISLTTFALCQIVPYSLTIDDLTTSELAYERTQRALDDLRVKERHEYYDFRSDAMSVDAACAGEDPWLLQSWYSQQRRNRMLDRSKAAEWDLATSQVIRRNEAVDAAFSVPSKFLRGGGSSRFSPPPPSQRYVQLYESRSKSSAVEHRVYCTTLGAQLPYGRCSKLNENGHRLSPYHDSPLQADDRGFVSDGLVQGVSPTQQFQNAQLAKPYVAMSSRVHNAGTHNREWNTAMGNATVREDSSLVYGGGQILEVRAGGDGSDTTRDERISIPIVCEFDRKHHGLIPTQFASPTHHVYNWCRARSTAGDLRTVFFSEVCRRLAFRREHAQNGLDPRRKDLFYRMMFSQTDKLEFIPYISELRKRLMPDHLLTGFKIKGSVSLWQWIRDRLRAIRLLACIALSHYAHMRILPNPLDTTIRLPFRVSGIVRKLTREGLLSDESSQPFDFAEPELFEAISRTVALINGHRNWLHSENIVPDDFQHYPIHWYLHSALTMTRLASRFKIKTLRSVEAVLAQAYSLFVATRLEPGVFYGASAILTTRAPVIQTQLQTKNAVTKTIDTSHGQERLDAVVSCTPAVEDMIMKCEFARVIEKNTGFSVVERESDTIPWSSTRVMKDIEGLFVKHDMFELVTAVSCAMNGKKLMESMRMKGMQELVLQSNEHVDEHGLSRAAGVARLDANACRKRLLTKHDPKDGMYMSYILSAMLGWSVSAYVMFVMVDCANEAVYAVFHMRVPGEVKDVTRMDAAEGEDCDDDDEEDEKSVVAKTSVVVHVEPVTAAVPVTVKAEKPRVRKPPLAQRLRRRLRLATYEMARARRVHTCVYNRDPVSAADLAAGAGRKSTAGPYSHAITLTERMRQRLLSELRQFAVENESAITRIRAKSSTDSEAAPVKKKPTAAARRPKRQKTAPKTSATGLAQKPTIPSAILPEPVNMCYVSMHRHLESFANADVRNCLQNTGISHVSCTDQGMASFLLEPSFFNAVTVLRHAIRPDVIPGSTYCTDAAVMQTVGGCSAAQETMTIEVMRALEGTTYIAACICSYPGCWESADGYLRVMSKTTHEKNALGFLNRSMYNNNAKNLIMSGTRTSRDGLLGKCAVLLGYGPRASSELDDVGRDRAAEEEDDVDDEDMLLNEHVKDEEEEQKTEAVPVEWFEDGTLVPHKEEACVKEEEEAIALPHDSLSMMEQILMPDRPPPAVSESPFLLNDVRPWGSYADMGDGASFLQSSWQPQRYEHAANAFQNDASRPSYEVIPPGYYPVQPESLFRIDP